MFQYRQALVRMRQGDSDRQIAAARIMGRRTAARLREFSLERNWLDNAGVMPEDEAIAAAMVKPKRGGTSRMQIPRKGSTRKRDKCVGLSRLSHHCRKEMVCNWDIWRLNSTRK